MFSHACMVGTLINLTKDVAKARGEESLGFDLGIKVEILI